MATGIWTTRPCIRIQTPKHHKPPAWEEIIRLEELPCDLIHMDASQRSPKSSHCGNFQLGGLRLFANI